MSVGLRSFNLGVQNLLDFIIKINIRNAKFELGTEWNNTRSHRELPVADKLSAKSINDNQKFASNHNNVRWAVKFQFGGTKYVTFDHHKP